MKLNNKGFTLIEILAVIAIIAIIGGIATMGVISAINTGKNTSNKVMIEDIITASQVLYEEVSYAQTDATKLYKYNNKGRQQDEYIEISEATQTISINLQTLVSNGFLNGTENSCLKENKLNEENETEENVCPNMNKRIIIDPKTKEDLGECKIEIKNENGNYTIIAVTDESVKVNCPKSYERIK